MTPVPKQCSFYKLGNKNVLRFVVETKLVLIDTLHRCECSVAFPTRKRFYCIIMYLYIVVYIHISSVLNDNIAG